MNKVQATIELLKRTGGQDEHGQFVVGSKPQQAAADVVEMYLHNFQELMDEAPADDFDEITGAVIMALQDIQVRDYTLGIMGSNTPQQNISVFNHLISNATSDTTNPLFALSSVAYYEDGQSDMAITTVKSADNDYSLAQLLARVYHAGWNPLELQKMRDSLHNQVKVGIFGEVE